MTTLDAQALVPEQAPTVAAALWQPERRLMLAVLEDALCDCLENAGALRGIRLARFRQASDWFRSDDTSWPYSFVNICEACGLDGVPGVSTFPCGDAAALRDAIDGALASPPATSLPRTAPF